jgi:hypothetical protein
METGRIGRRVGEIRDNNIARRSPQQANPELPGPVRVDRPDDPGVIVPAAFLNRHRGCRPGISHLPECRATPPDKPAVEDRMGKEAGMCRLPERCGVEPPVKFHDAAQGGIAHDPDRIRKKIKGRCFPGVHGRKKDFLWL